jgi:hypothetical protein
MSRGFLLAAFSMAVNGSIPKFQHPLLFLWLRFAWQALAQLLQPLKTRVWGYAARSHNADVGGCEGHFPFKVACSFTSL